MYEAYYGFKGTPFSKDMKPEQLYLNSQLKELHSRLKYLKKYRGIMLLTGEPGTGKTTVLRSFIEQLNLQRFLPVYIPLATLGVKEFYSQLNDSLKGEPVYSKKALFNSIQERIIDLSVNQNRTPVLVFDEAHFFKNENFFELQLITNFKMDSYDPYLVILSAQTHLHDRLSRPTLRSFNQRIQLKFHLAPLSPSECKKYIFHHLALHEVDSSLFTEPAYKAIFNISHGIIRIIGKLILKSLSLGAHLNKSSLTEEEILKAAKEL